MAFGFSNDPIKKLEKEYAKKTEQAIAAQRSGKLPKFAELTAEAEELGRQLDAARASNAAGTEQE